MATTTRYRPVLHRTRPPSRASRRHHHQPDRFAWTAQEARKFHDADQRTIRFVIRDGAGQFVAGFDDVFRTDGATVIGSPPGTPVANAYAERWIASVRRELLD